MRTKNMLLLFAALAASLASLAKGLQPVAWSYDSGNLIVKDETVSNRTSNSSSIYSNSENKAYDGDNGYVDFVIKDASKAKWIGIYDIGGNTIIGLFYFSSGKAYIYKNGVQTEDLGSVLPGDRFRIELSGSNVYFSRNGNPAAAKVENLQRGNKTYCFRIALSPGASFSGVKTTVGIPYTLNSENDASGYNLVHTITPQIAVASVHRSSERHTGKYAETISYADGLGRPVKTVSYYGSPTAKHIVQNREYDQYGREPRAYLPYTQKRGSAVPSYSGWNEEQYAFIEQQYPGEGGNGFTETRFDGSPLNRPVATIGTGGDWKGEDGTEDAARYELGSNTADILRITVSEAAPLAKFWLGSEYYKAGSLRLERSFDENGDLFETFTDGEGKPVLKRSYGGSDMQTATYYGYDKMGRLRLVVQPEGAIEIEQMFAPAKGTSQEIPADLVFKQAFCYEYDSRGRVIRKQIPSVASVSGGEISGNVKMVYNSYDQLVLYQDGKLEEEHKWRYFKYDALGREVYSGIYLPVPIQNPNTQVYYTQEELQAFAAASTGRVGRTPGGSYDDLAYPSNSVATTKVEKKTYYDDYNYPEISGSFTLPAGFSGKKAARNRGRVTAVMQRVLGTETFLTTRYCYDKYGRLLQTVSDNIAGGQDILTTEYDFTGRPLKVLTQSTALQGSFTYLERYEYDHMGRLINTYGTANGGDEVLVSHNSYDETGKLKETNFHDTKEHGPIQSVDYKYNIRGWLTDINDTETDDGEGDLFKMKLCYNDPSILNSADVYQQHNGNISAAEWISGSDPAKHAYLYFYNMYSNADVYPRGPGLTYAVSYTDRLINRKKECKFKYDYNGNIIFRYTSDNSSYLDYLNYRYDGNRLMAVGDNAIMHNINRGDFYEASAYEGNTLDEYEYDLAGNMTEDRNRGISIEYNSLNLPKKVTRNGDYIEYAYDASGNKLKVSVDGAADSYYCGNVVYSPSGFDYATVGGARIVNKGGNLRYEYSLADHLGNTRAVYTDTDKDGNADLLQEEAYYPFGMRIPSMSKSYSGSSDDRYLYNGKELEDRIEGFHFYDYGARFYDAALARWHSVDPLAEKYTSLNPYNYVGNNPINSIDPNGMFSFTVTGDDLEELGVEDVKAFTTYLLGVANNIESFAADNDNNDVMDELVMSTGLSKSQVLSDMKSGNGPVVNLQANLPFMGESNDPANGTITMDLGSFVGEFNAINSGSSYDAYNLAAANLMYTLHEYTHYGDAQTNGSTTGDSSFEEFGSKEFSTVGPPQQRCVSISGHRGTDTDQQILYGQIYSRGSQTYIENGGAPTYFIEGNRFKTDPRFNSLVRTYTRRFKY